MMTRTITRLPGPSSTHTRESSEATLARNRIGHSAKRITAKTEIRMSNDDRASVGDALQRNMIQVRFASSPAQNDLDEAMAVGPGT